jgi:arylsulfatase
MSNGVADPGAGLAERPNILIIMADDLGYSDLGCYGSEIATPNLDQLAAEGMRMTQFYSAARCCPSRASLLTGAYPHTVGMGEMSDIHYTLPAYRGLIAENVATIGEALQTVGYETLISGKWHVGDEPSCWPCNRGFDRSFVLLGGASSYFEIKPYRDERWLEICPSIDVKLMLNDRVYEPPADGFYLTDALTDQAIKFLRTNAEVASPFFLLVTYTAPHWPLHALPEDIAKYADRYDDGWDQLRQSRFDRMKQFGLVQPETQLPPREKEAKSWDELSPAVRDEYARKMTVYAAMIDRMDQNIGRLQAELRRQNRLDDTLVVFLSDNGACRAEGVPFTSHWDKSGPIGSPQSFTAYGHGFANASNTPLRRYKAELYEGGIASPLIARYPKLIRANTIHRSVGHIMDLMPTCLELAGASPDKSGTSDATVSMEGQSLLPVFRGGTPRRDTPLFWEHLGRRAVRDGHWKLVAPRDEPWELYHLADDPTELVNLAEEHPERVNKLASNYAMWAEAHGVLSPVAREPYQISPEDYRQQLDRKKQERDP